MPSNARAAAACWIALSLASLGCAAKNQVLVPPRVDLAAYGAIGIIEFAARPDADHGDPATRQFVQMLQEAQPGAPILELGARDAVLAKVGQSELDFEAVRAIGEHYRVDAVFSGDLEMSRLKPNIRFGRSFTSMKASANINGELAVRLMETRAGATVWSRTATSTANVARVGVPAGGGVPTFGATAPEDVERGLVGSLVSDLAYDFRSHWVTQ